jgi:hypothetical protein
MAHIVLTNVTTGKKFKAHNNPRFAYDKSTPLSALMLPEVPETQTNIVKIEGVEAKIRLSFIIKQETEDVSLGTRTGGLTDFYDQLNWIIDNFVTPSINENHRVEIIEGATTKFTRDGVFTSINVNWESGRGYIAEIELEFLVGLVL